MEASLNFAALGMCPAFPSLDRGLLWRISVIILLLQFEKVARFSLLQIIIVLFSLANREAVKGQNFVSGMLHAMLLKTYADIAKELGVAPGGEFRRAYHEVSRVWF